MSVVPHQPISYAQHVALIREGRESPRDILEICIDRINQSEQHISAFVSYDLNAARAAADQSSHRWKAGAPLSPIDGMPIGVKDVIETIDLPTQMGSAYFKNWHSNRDGASVAALREAGAIILGKTVTTEFAATVAGPTRNPHDLTRTPGGSSSGSAAGVAAGFMSGGLGTQVVGSIVRPASYCGVWGFKPTVGALNRGGSHDYMSQSCAGVLAATRDDAWLMAIEIARRVGGDPGMYALRGPAHTPHSQRPKKLIMLETAGWSRAHADAKNQLNKALSQLTHAGIEILTRADMGEIDALEKDLQEALPLTRVINAWESLWPLNTYCLHHPELISKNMHERLGEARALSLSDYEHALQRRDQIRAAYAHLKKSADGFITLSAPDVAPVGIESTGDPIFVVPGSFLGVPALNIPSFTLHNLPLGLQVLGFAHEDADLFAHAGDIETIVAS